MSDSFGPATMAALQANYPSVDTTSILGGINRVIQSALYCKGYDGEDINGVFGSRTAAAVTKMKTEMGVIGSSPGGSVTPKVFKALLNLDAYVLLTGGTSSVQSVQRWMNGKYLSRRDYQIIPCDGNFSRDVQSALMYAIQYTAGMADGVANGNFGPGTQSALQSNPLTVGSTGDWVRLFSAAMLFNRRPNVTFTSTYTSTLSTRVKTFQSFVKLPQSGNADFATWASLLVSHGDQSRSGTAADTSTTLNAARIDALKAAGYQVVGRYLCRTPGSSFAKEIQPGELALCASKGLKVFPIFQTSGDEVGYFTYERGLNSGHTALNYARWHGFKPGSRIYFAVDFDAMDHEVDSAIIPYFSGIADVMQSYGFEYKTGIYASRNICSRVSALELADASFVSDMSSKFSGNMGYPLPANWAFDQIVTTTVGTGSGAIAVDKNIASGRDVGQATFSPTGTGGGFNERKFPFEQRGLLLDNLRTYLFGLGYGDTGSPGPEGLLRLRSTPESLDKVLEHDELITSLANTLRIRKALIQSVLFQEVRHYSSQDVLSDTWVVQYHEGLGALPGYPSDSSTGIGQIYGWVAIQARNWGIVNSKIGGVQMDSQNEDHCYLVWKKLKNDESFNVSTIPLVLLHGASKMSDVTPPHLDSTDAHTQRILGRYNGTGDAADEYGAKVFGYYQIFEAFNLAARSFI
ncbi:glycoside hydrolase domain-containing protein [Nocardioides zeae]|uniref:glycoside hydrolase domain-containing protein n=1 Tax=Nocardioides zeae TaxID=1457234 RepID=UPI0019D69583|nr:glycoside hydrolase domain-containing protein [Nocardioides zeae]